MVDEDALERRLAVFRHEAATPVSLIAAALHELERGRRTDADAAELLDTALRQTERLQRLLEQLRGTGPEALSANATRLDLVALAADVIADLELTILADRDCRLDRHDGPVMVDADPGLLWQLLTNLLDNAVKYTSASTTIHVRVGVDGDEAELAVTDEGDGIAPDDLRRIFRRFERADDDREGLGLGLYLVWRIAAAHDGRVRAEPAPSGSGTRFVVHLPAAERT